MQTLDLGLVGNGIVSALIGVQGDIVWSCLPRFDSDPMFCALLTKDAPDIGVYGIDLDDRATSSQEYIENTAVLRTTLTDRHGGQIEIVDYAPRFMQFGRLFSPTTLIRRIRRVHGQPRIRVRLRPGAGYGSTIASATSGSNHVRFVGADATLRLTTDMPLTYVRESTWFLLVDEITLVLGPDESLQESVASLGRRFLEETVAHWRGWVRALAIPFEWQEVVIRAAITLKLNAFEDTGAIVAAMTTSIPEAAHSQRNWDYRYCWIRDAYFVVDALNRLGATHTMERYLEFLLNLISAAPDGRLQPLYTVSGRSDLEEREITSLAGYRGMGPVRIGNEAYRQRQHDVYGAAILAAAHIFFDRRLERRGDAHLFARLERLGEHASALFDQPDAGIWELRGRESVHTYSSVMCWAGCDRLARIARQLELWSRADYWRTRANAMHEEISRRCWNPTLGSFVATMDGTELDASLLRLHEVGFIRGDDPRFRSTVEVVGRTLRRGRYIFRYIGDDDFGAPENAFLACTFWYINALAVSGRADEARVLYDHVLCARNHVGLLAEHIDPATQEQWGNFVQTYSMVGLISAAVRLSSPWEDAF
jgi:GH15 family glucan-1,4-alpha-glucosidase